VFRGGKKMNRIIAIIAVALIFSLGFVSANVYAGGGMSKGWHRAYEVGEIVGSDVKTPEGEELGRIHDFVIDSNGRVAFMILAYGGFMGMGEKRVAIPFGAFTYDRIGRHLVLDVSREKLESAPSFERSELLNPKWAEDTYKYFGLQPYWTEGGHTEGTGFTMEQPNWPY
jgi:sporulation protein YlmC with PRC-barrel domain